MNFIKQIKFFDSTKFANRNSAIDVFRGTAILAVVLQHYNDRLPFGELGVDLFFVLSGFLIGGILIQEIEKETKLNWLKFVTQRAFKIIPSYYCLLILGTLIAHIIYRDDPKQIIELWDFKRYIFFYCNIVGEPRHYSFGQLWSLSVEEQFYIALPLLFLAMQLLVPKKHILYALFATIIALIIMFIVAKYFSYKPGISQVKTFGKYNKDSLAWGVLLSLIMRLWGHKIKQFKYTLVFFVIGLITFFGTLYLSYILNPMFRMVFYHTFVSISFFLMILGVYYNDFTKWKALRIIAYYSYNWYLWHRLFVIFMTRQMGDTLVGMGIYIVFTFILAVLATVFIEEPFLRKRKELIAKWFK